MNYLIQENGQVLSTQFDRLPNSVWFPVYYEKIAKPITMIDIRERIESYLYGTSDELMADFTRMFQNAYDYYPAGSEIVSDATTLEQVAEDAAKRVTNGTVMKLPSCENASWAPTAPTGGEVRDDSEAERPGPSKPKSASGDGLAEDLRRIYYGTSGSDSAEGDPSYTPEWVGLRQEQKKKKRTWSRSAQDFWLLLR